MRVSDFSCPSCAAAYEVAESASPLGRPGRAECRVCGQLLASWHDRRLRAYRLTLSVDHKYRPVTPPPSPMNI
jgi:hypothetical protein